MKVKELEWHDEGEGLECWRARPDGGPIYSAEDDGFSSLKYHVTAHQLVLGTFPTLAEAKAAAQADYDARILSALSTTLQEPKEVSVKGNRCWVVRGAEAHKAFVTEEEAIAFAGSWGKIIPMVEAGCNGKIEKSVSDEELSGWAEKRADDAGRLARELIQYRFVCSPQEAGTVEQAARVLYDAWPSGGDMPEPIRSLAERGHFFTALRLIFEPDADVRKPAPTLAHQPVTAGLEKALEDVRDTALEDAAEIIDRDVEYQRLTVGNGVGAKLLEINAAAIRALKSEGRK